jgi:hypothetical protein
MASFVKIAFFGSKERGAKNRELGGLELKLSFQRRIKQTIA